LSPFAYLKVIALGGEMMPTEMLEKWETTNVKLINIYGVTECCVYQAYSILNFPQSKHPAALRVRLLTHSMKGNRMLLVREDDQMREIEEGSGERGEMAIAGEQIAIGYLNRDELTSQR